MSCNENRYNENRFNQLSQGYEIQVDEVTNEDLTTTMQNPLPNVKLSPLESKEFDLEPMLKLKNLNAKIERMKRRPVL